jgi:branched-chain amino acid transport system ATP-binding protein
MFWTESGIPVLMVLIGGSGIFLGPALGAVFYTFLAAKVQSSTIYWDLIIGSVLLFVVLVLPGGLASVPERARALVARVRTPRTKEPEVEPIMAMSPHPDPAHAGNPATLTTMAPPQAGEGDFREREREIDKGEGRKLAGSNGHLLVVRGLSKHFMGLRAVDGVDLDVKTGRVHAVIGPNGAGKSTLFNLVSGRMRPDSGKVVFDGADVTGAPPNQLAHVGMGRGFQTTAVFPRLTVEENLRLALMGIHGDTRRPFGNAGKLYRDEVDQTITSVGLEGRAATPARELSHGHQRALELGISLALGARLLLLDEPTAGMSPYETRRTLELLQQVIEDRDVTLLITEHDMEVVFGIADTVTVMAEGHVLTEGSPDHVRNHPDVIRVYLGTES